jgi:hypothetical protein
MAEESVARLLLHPQCCCVLVVPCHCSPLSCIVAARKEHQQQLHGMHGNKQHNTLPGCFAELLQSAAQQLRLQQKGCVRCAWILLVQSSTHSTAAPCVFSLFALAVVEAAAFSQLQHSYCNHSTHGEHLCATQHCHPAAPSM